MSNWCGYITFLEMSNEKWFHTDNGNAIGNVRFVATLSIKFVLVSHRKMTKTMSFLHKIDISYRVRKWTFFYELQKDFQLFHIKCTTNGTLQDLLSQLPAVG